MLSNFFWGAPVPQEPKAVDALPHTTREEAGDWLLVSSQNSCGELWLSSSNCAVLVFYRWWNLKLIVGLGLLGCF